MELTGKCKEDFENWLSEKIDFPDNEFYVFKINCNGFDSLTSSMQYGVMVDFFDSRGIGIEVEATTSKIFRYMVHNWNKQHFQPIQSFKTRQEARKEAIKKANEIFNQPL